MKAKKRAQSQRKTRKQRLRSNLSKEIIYFYNIGEIKSYLADKKLTWNHNKDERGILYLAIYKNFIYQKTPTKFLNRMIGPNIMVFRQTDTQEIKNDSQWSDSAGITIEKPYSFGLLSKIEIGEQIYAKSTSKESKLSIADFNKFIKLKENMLQKQNMFKQLESSKPYIATYSELLHTFYNKSSYGDHDIFGVVTWAWFEFLCYFLFRKYMQWSGEKLLKKTQPRNTSNVRICAFRLVGDFVLFSLQKTRNNSLELPSGSGAQAKNVIGSDVESKYVGHLNYNGETYMWYDCSMNDVPSALFLTKSERKWWALSSEIVNWEKVLHFPIEKAVVDLFIAHPEMLFVENLEGQKYECPLVGYYGAYYTKILKLAIIGAPKSEWEFSSLGPHYYFGNYDAGMRYAFAPMSMGSKIVYHSGENIVNHQGKYKRGGLARFALRLGKEHTMLLGKVRDRSKPTREGVKEGKVREEDAPFRDPDAKWAKLFDAVLLGRRKVKDRNTKEERTLNPQYILKRFHQHIPLSFHYVKTEEQDAKTGVIE